jgi:hypothetical protein
LYEHSGRPGAAIQIWTTLRQAQPDDRVWREFAEVALKRLAQESRR